MATLLGFDYGTAKIGIAVGQSITGTASPLITLRAVRQHPTGSGGDLILSWQPSALVVGLPATLTAVKPNYPVLQNALRAGWRPLSPAGTYDR